MGFCHSNRIRISFFYTAVGTQMSVVPALVGDLYGVKHFGRNWGTISFVNAIVASIFQVSDDINPICDEVCNTVKTSALALTVNDIPRPQYSHFINRTSSLQKASY